MKALLISCLNLSVISFCSMTMGGQTTIDARGPIRPRVASPSSGTVGSSGRKLPVQISMECLSCPSNGEGNADIAFVIRNTAEKDIILPICPNPGDLEPKARDVTYNVKNLTLYITGDDDRELMRIAGIELYGSDAFPGTLQTLPPGKSVRVLVRLDLPSSTSATKEQTRAFLAHAVLNDETVKITDGRASETVDEIGSAVSPAYKPR